MTTTSPGALDVSLPWLRSVRRAVWACQALLLLWAWLGLSIHLQVAWLAALIALGFASDGLASWWQRRGVTENELLALMLLDAGLHTAVFALSGGPFNPFTALYLVNVVLAALVLSRARQWLQLGASLAGFASLFLVGKVAPAAWQLPNHQELMRLHLTGMWIAFVVAAAFIVYFVQRVLASLRAQQTQLAEAKRLTAQHEKLAALTTLAAGAAHELATPLGTIAIASQEMQRALEMLEVPEALRDDARLVRQQVERCRAILESMSAKSGELAGEALIRFPVAPWLAAVVAGLTDGQRVVVGECTELLDGPPSALAQAVKNLLKNALEASTGPVRVCVKAVPAGTAIVVEDAGPGVDVATLERMGEPFFTTKPAGKGMGLGVFLARTLAVQLGGSLRYMSAPGSGTTATFTIPTKLSGEPRSGDAGPAVLHEATT